SLGVILSLTCQRIVERKWLHLIMDDFEIYINMKCIGNYQLGKTIGSGTFGKVKLAIHIPTQQQVAIKIMNKERMVDIIDIERVQRELHILKIVRHPNIIMLYDILETPKHIFLVMEYCQKELFQHIVKSKRIQEIHACSMFQQLLSGVEYLHKLNITHRDIKPENLLIKGRIKIVDFGLSNTYSELLKTACGSPCYAAPEMISGKQYNGLKADLWSCGVVLFVMMCGYLPFEDSNTNTLYKKILAASYKLPNFLSSDAADIIKLILNPDPDARPGIDDIRKHPWFNLYKTNHQLKQGIIIGQNKIPIDTNIVGQVEKLGHDRKFIFQCLHANEHNDATTSYYLLLDQAIQSGIKTIADIASDQFQAQLVQQNLETTNSDLNIKFDSDSSPIMKKSSKAEQAQFQEYPQQNIKSFFKVERPGRTIRAESESNRQTIDANRSLDMSRNNARSISISEYYTERMMNKELPLPPIPQLQKKRKFKLRNTLMHIQNAYGVKK
ncbi:hypothetical protein pb186bvf_018573, partial [Paramecium bursaria]